MESHSDPHRHVVVGQQDPTHIRRTYEGYKGFSDGGQTVHISFKEAPTSGSKQRNLQTLSLLSANRLLLCQNLPTKPVPTANVNICFLPTMLSRSLRSRKGIGLRNRRSCAEIA